MFSETRYLRRWACMTHAYPVDATSGRLLCLIAYYFDSGINEDFPVLTMCSKVSLEAFGFQLLTNGHQEGPASQPIVFRIDPVAILVGFPGSKDESESSRNWDLYSSHGLQGHLFILLNWKWR